MCGIRAGIPYPRIVVADSLSPVQFTAAGRC
jgi:hypothetical protein